MNLPNKLTFIRLVLAIPFIYFLQESGNVSAHLSLTYRLIAFAIFVIASLTDFLMVILLENIILLQILEN